MIAKVGKRSLAFLLAVLMLISVVPAPAYATEGEHDHEHECLHEYTTVVTDPGCETPGFTTWTCALCDDSYVTDEVAALLHNYEKGEPVAPTPEARGYTPYTCALCGKVEQADFVDYVAPASQEPEVEEPEVEEPEVEDEPVVDQEPAEDTPSDLALDAAARINALLALYGITSDMTDDQIGKAIMAQPWSVNKPNIAEVNAIEAMAEEATEADEEYVLANADVETFVRFLNIWKPMFAVAMAAATGTHTPIEGVTVGVSGATDNSMSNGAVTVTAKGSGGVFGIGASSKTATITVTNSSEKPATISFDWTATSVYSLVIDGSGSSATSGSFSKLMSPNENITITITTTTNNTTNKLVMNNFGLVEAKTSSNVAFEYDSTLGSITVGGVAVASGVVQEVGLVEGVALVATANDSKFLGWVNTVDNSLLSTEASYTLTTADDMTVKAVFAKDGETPWFVVGDVATHHYKREISIIIKVTVADFNYYNVSGNYLVEGFDAAVALAENSTSKYMVLMNNATLSSGTYTIPSGVTMLIPFDDANTLYTTGAVSTGTWTEPREYRALTLADGANLVVNGALSLSAKHKYAVNTQTNGGTPTGDVSFIYMQGNSRITVTGSLYAYGYILGSGSVTAKNGAKIYENFQINDFRGGSQSTEMKNAVFPMSQYYIQNIEVPLTLEYGSTEYAVATIFMSSTECTTAVAFIGKSGCMFNQSNESGYITKRYDGTKDRIIVDAYGTLKMSPVNMPIGISEIDSEDYVLPINSNFTVRMLSGTTATIEQQMAFLPGTQIIVDENAICSLANGVNIYVYDQDDWGNYCFTNNGLDAAGNLIPVDKKLVPAYSPTKAYTRTEADLVDAEIRINGTIDASKGKVYTTTGGANVCSDGGGKVSMIVSTKDTKTYQLMQASGGTYAEIPVSCGKLKNADGSYTVTFDASAATAASFIHENGTWRRECDGTNHVLGDSEEYLAPTCTEAGYLKGTCIDCDKSVDDPINALGHTEVVDDAVAATCETDGLTEGKHCSVCNEVIIAQTVVNALGHEWNEPATTPATCEGTGLKTYTCQNDNSHEKTEEIPALGHNMIAGEVTAPTCTEAGYTSYYCYNNCGKTEERDSVPALGHTWSKSINYDATDAQIPEREKLTAIRKCEVCNTEESKETDIVETPVAATCTTKGSITYTADFDVDWETNPDKVLTVNIDINPGNHVSLETLPGKEATCTETGLEECTKCVGGCGNWYDSEGNLLEIHVQPVIEMKDHAYGEVEYTWTITYTHCTAKRVCADCDKVESLTQLGTKSEVKEANCRNPESGKVYVNFSEDWAKDQNISYECPEDMINPNNHVNTEEHEAVNPTCEKTGRNAGTWCKDCEKYIRGGAEVSKREHSFDQEGVVTAPTCTEKGYTTYKCQFSNCGHEYTADEVAALGHTAGDPVQENVTNATCEASGSYEEVVYCSVCKAKISRETKTIDRLPHTEVIDEAVAPTCTETGLTEGSHCSVCGEVILAQKVVEALGHTEVVDDAVAATCETDGLTEGKHCSVCGEVILAQETVEALGHDYNAEVTTEATCTEPGVKTFTCKRGDHSYTESITALGHNEVKHDAKAPTCTEKGWNAYVSCDRCDYTTYVETPATGHSPDETVIEKEVDATCTTDGSYDTVVYCFVCDEELSRQTVVVPALGHTEGEAVTENKVNATCSTAGSYDTVVYCTVCKAEISRVTIPVEKLSHTPADWVKENEVDATCTKTGSYDKVIKCKICGEEISREAITTEALDHQFTTYTSNNDATCTADGTKTAKCDRCDKMDTVTDKGSALGHTEAEAIEENRVEASCTAEGSYDSVVYCSVCNTERSRETKNIEKIAHTPAEAVTENVVAATCTENGSYESVVKCSVCKEELSRTTVAVPATNHKDTTETIPEKAATCTESGLTEGSKCTACNTTLVEQKVIEATGHTYVDGVCHCGESELTVSYATEGITFEVAGRVVTVTYSIPCKVGYLVNDAYVAIAAVANEDGSYSFTAPEGVKEVIVVVKGDANDDGQVTNADATKTGATYLSKTTLSVTGQFAADVNNDSEITNADATKTGAVYLAKTTLSW